MTLDDFEDKLIRLSNAELIDILQSTGMLKKEFRCVSVMNLIDCKHYKDLKCWRCPNSDCLKSRPKINIRKGSFFEGLSPSLLKIMKVLIRWSEDIPQGRTVSRLGIDHRTYKKIIQKILNLVRFDFSDDKLGGPNMIVQIDETALNHSVKTHRGRVPNNKTDALCIVEFEHNIKRAFACVIEDKGASTIIPIICANITSNATIHTDEHKSYSSLNDIGFVHNTFFHKYKFVNPETDANTQAVESFNNCIKLDIKKEKE